MSHSSLVLKCEIWSIKFMSKFTRINVPESGKQVRELKLLFAEQVCYCVGDWDTCKT